MNDRIRILRESLNLTRAAFGERIGVSGDVINNLERGRVDVKDHIAKLICKEFNVNEDWLRDGIGSMFIEADTFSLDAFCEQRHATDLEKEIIKAYLDLDPEIRKKVIEHFKSRLGRFGESSSPNVTVFRAARSDSDTPPGMAELPASDLEKLKTATPITSDDDI